MKRRDLDGHLAVHVDRPRQLGDATEVRLGQTAAPGQLGDDACARFQVMCDRGVEECDRTLGRDGAARLSWAAWRSQTAP